MSIPCMGTSCIDDFFTDAVKCSLTRMAKQGRAAEKLVQEAVERLLNYDEWFSREVDRGLAAADRGEFVEHGAFVGI
jgi:predicted transcriptional regulator